MTDKMCFFMSPFSLVFDSKSMEAIDRLNWLQ